MAGVVVVIGFFAGTVAEAAPTPAAPGHAAHTDLTSPHGTDTDTDTDTDKDTAIAALAAARKIADGTPGADMVVPAVAVDLGYEPVVEQASAAKRTGDCSSPVPLPRSFEPACRVHDLGYDLLRVAHRHQVPIPPGLRSDLDALLARQLHDSCEGRTACTVMADIAHAAVQLNTVRQRHGAPVEETLPW
ncbi:hypothetical protein [Dietzia aurantiaca]|uniref:DUF732 domain-containing protein n=1 Tax=Dietzia aurantiaca TaxID=983873 RepID=A0ABV9PV39_9ACTN